MKVENFLLEIYLEEIPHLELPQIIDKLANLFQKELTNQDIKFKNIIKFSTPKRLTLLIEGIPTTIASQKIIKKGPPLKISFNQEQPTPTLTGWISNINQPLPHLKSLKKITPEATKPGIYLESEEKGDVLVFLNHKPEKKTSEILLKTIPSLLKNLSFEKKMYWNEQLGPFIRPVHSFCCLLGSKIIPFRLWGLTASNITWGHAQLNPKSIILNHPNDYERELKQHQVIVPVEKRIEIIEKQAKEICSNNRISLVEKDRVIKMVAHLTEYPHLILAKFDKNFLDLPEELIINELIEHQKYFPVKKDDQLTNYFVITSNIKNEKWVKRGNERVISSRLNDGRFLFNADLKLGLNKMKEKLNNVIFQEELGTYQDKINRLILISQALNKNLGWSLNTNLLKEGANLIKSDLTSGLVNEFPHLQGTIGFYYAQYEKRDPLLISAIKEHYYPINVYDPLPTNDLSIILSLSDKIDNVLGLLAVGFMPTANQDRYGIKRQGLAIIKILIEKNINLDFFKFLNPIKENYLTFIKATNEKKKADWNKKIKNFFIARLRNYLKEKEMPSENLNAFNVSNGFNPFKMINQLRDLKKIKTSPKYKDLLDFYKRIENFILKEKENSLTTQVNTKIFIAPEEIKLWEEKKKIDKNLIDSSSHSTQMENILIQKLELLEQYKKPVENFFNNVLINHPDEQVKKNRKNLLTSVYFQIKQTLNLSILYHKKTS